MNLQMIVSSVAPPAAVASGTHSRLHGPSYNRGFSGGGVTSGSTKLSSSYFTLFPVQKDVVGSFIAFKYNLDDRVSMHAVASKAESYSEVDLMSTDTLELKFEDALILEPESSSIAKKSKKADTQVASVAKKSKEGGTQVASVDNKSKKGKNPKQLSTSAALIKSTDHFQIIRYPLGTEAAIKAMLECNTLVFVVDKRADKKNIKEAATNMFKIRVKKVNTSITPDGTKKAYLMLTPDFKAADVAKRIKIL